MITFYFAEVQSGFFHSEIHVEWCDLLPQDQQMFDQEQLAVHGRLTKNGRFSCQSVKIWGFDAGVFNLLSFICAVLFWLGTEKIVWTGVW